MPDRRTFLITCGSVIVTPALGQFPLQSTGVGLHGTLAPVPVPQALKIHGWEPRTDDASDVWIRINASWRATWR